MHTGAGRDSSTDIYWGENGAVWNNDGDRATLANRKRQVLDTCEWGDDDAASTTC